MLNYRHKTFPKLISLILAQIFLLTGVIYPESITNKNISSLYIQARYLRVPLDSSNGYARAGDMMSKAAAQKSGTNTKTSNQAIADILFKGDLKDRVVALENGKFALKKVVKLSSLTDAEDRKKFAKGLFKMGQRVSNHSLVLMKYAGLISEDADYGLPEIYAAIDENVDEWDILALQIVTFSDLQRKEPILATWVKSNQGPDFIGNQILAFTINDLLNNGTEKVKSSNVAYTERVRKSLSSGVNDISEMRNFLSENALNLLTVLKEEELKNPSAAEVLKRLLDSAASEDTGQDRGITLASNAGITEAHLREIENKYPAFGSHVRRAINFLRDRILDGKPFLEGVSGIKIIENSNASSAEISGDILVIKLRDTSFFTEEFEQEAFLYFLYLLASSRGTFGDQPQVQALQRGNVAIFKEGKLERVILKGDKGITFMLVANFKKDGDRDKTWQFVGLFAHQGGDSKVNSTIIQEGVCTEFRSRIYTMPHDNRFYVGVPPGCEILRFTSQRDPEFKKEDIREILGVSPDLKEVLTLFVAANVFKKGEKTADIHRITIITNKEENVSASISTEAFARELIISIPQKRNPTLSEMIGTLAPALGKLNLALQIMKKVIGKMYIRPEMIDAINEAQKNINKAREPMLAATKATWDRRKYIYREMTKERPADKRIAGWVMAHAPYLKDKIIVSWQMEMGFHPELSLSLMNILQEEVDAGNISIEEAEDIFKKTEMSSMAGGLGALMPDWLRALADNGAEVISLNMIYKTYEHEIETREWHRKAVQNMPGMQTENLEVRLKDGTTRKIDFHMCRLGMTLQIWIEELDERDKIYITEKLYKGYQESYERVAEMDFYNAAGQAVIKWLRENKVRVVNAAVRNNNTIDLLNEVYTYLPKKTSSIEIPVNHTVVASGIPFFNAEYLEGIVDRDTLEKIKDKNDKAHLEVLSLMRAARILGVSKDHTRILKALFSIWVDNVSETAGLTQDKKTELLNKIVRDEEYSTSNGAHPKHFQAPEIQDLIERYKLELGDKTMDDDAFRLKIEDSHNVQIKQRFMEELDGIIFELQKYLISLLQSQRQALGWEASKRIPTGGIIRRIVDYKELYKFVMILENEELRKRFVNSGVRIIVGGRFGQQLLEKIRGLVEQYGLKNQVAIFYHYNIGDAPLIFQGENFTVMLSRKGEEAAATSLQKEALNGGPTIGVRDGICHESEGFFEPFNSGTGAGNGFFVDYDEEGRPIAESIVKAFEDMSRVFKNPTQRKQIQFNALMKGLEFNEVTHQARGTLNIMNQVLEEKGAKLASNQMINGSILQGIKNRAPLYFQKDAQWFARLFKEVLYLFYSDEHKDFEKLNGTLSNPFVISGEKLGWLLIRAETADEDEIIEAVNNKDLTGLTGFAERPARAFLALKELKDVLISLPEEEIFPQPEFKDRINQALSFIYNEGDKQWKSILYRTGICPDEYLPKTITVKLEEHPGDEYKSEISTNAMAIFNSLGYDMERDNGGVVLNLGSGGNPITSDNFINVDNLPFPDLGGKRFFEGDWLKNENLLADIQQQELRHKEHVRGILLYNVWSFITHEYTQTHVYDQEALLAAYDARNNKIKEEMLFKQNFAVIWKNILPDGGDIVLIDFMPPLESRDPYESQEVVLKAEKFIKDLRLDDMAGITRIEDETSGHIVGLAVKKRAAPQNNTSAQVLHGNAMVRHAL